MLNLDKDDEEQFRNLVVFAIIIGTIWGIIKVIF
jgi:hypothetical protein